LFGSQPVTKLITIFPTSISVIDFFNRINLQEIKQISKWNLSRYNKADIPSSISDKIKNVFHKRIRSIRFESYLIEAPRLKHCILYCHPSFRLIPKSIFATYQY
jgi:LEA14-like dessication related protein